MILKKVFDFYLKSSLHVGFAVFCLLQISGLQLDVFIDKELGFFVFCATVLGYNFLKFAPIFSFALLKRKMYLSIFVLTVSSFLGTVYFYFLLNDNTKIGFLLAGILVLIYPFLRKLWVFKIITVSFCVTYVTVFIPTLSDNLILKNYWFLFFERFIVLICLLIPFEITDSENDAQYLKTIPLVIGIENTKMIGYFLLILFLILDFFFLKLNFEIDVVIVIFTAVAIYFSNENRSKYYTSFWVESIPVFWWIFLLVFSNSF